MMSIGRFAHASGLSVTALRFYDSTGLLEPAQVDPDTGYRRYSASQLRRAATIRLLREMGMSTTQVREVVDAPDRGAELVDAYRQEVAAARERQDRAIADGVRTLESYDRPATVEVRRAGRQPWVGVVMPVDLATVDAEEDSQRYNEAFGGLAGALTESGNPPVGPFWTTIRNDDSGTGGELVLCWPVADPVRPADLHVPFDGLRIEQGVLPERSECFVRIAFDAPDGPEDAAPDGPPHPALIALLEHVEQLGGDPDLVRQVGVPGPDGIPVGIDVAVTLPG